VVIGGLARSVRQLADGTPASRDRTVDLLRALAIFMVVLGHWTVATVSRTTHGIAVGNVLSVVPGLQPVTWVFQVMGLFFVVGGFSTRRTIEGRPEFEVGAFFATRAERLLRPTVVFVVLWMVAAAGLAAVSVDPHLTHSIARIAAQPLWFLAVYLVVTLIAPAQLALHRRYPVLLLVMVPVVVALVDWLRIDDVVPALGVLNYLFVFAFAQELGFHLASRWDGIDRRLAATVAALATVTLVLLVTVGPYPVSMVGLPGARVSNMSPPTLCILLLTIVHVGVATVLRPGMRRRLARPAAWTATVAANAGIMTVFLWHLSAASAVGAGLYVIDALPVPGSAGWWWWKVPWVIACTLVLAVFVLVFVGIERAPSRCRDQRGAVLRRAVGMLVALRGLAGFALTGFDHWNHAGGSAFLGTRFSPVVDLGLLLGGYLLACGLPRRARAQA
jgi:fucose 4-O-acetylase-like acetyltransferase